MGEANPGNSATFLFFVRMLQDERNAATAKKEIHLFISLR
jgi:hypothetical protein